MYLRSQFSKIVKLGGDGFSNGTPKFEYMIGEEVVVKGQLTTTDDLQPKIDWFSAADAKVRVSTCRDVGKNMKNESDEWERFFFKTVVVAADTDSLGLFMLSVCACRYWNDSQGSALE